MMQCMIQYVCILNYYPCFYLTSTLRPVSSCRTTQDRSNLRRHSQRLTWPMAKAALFLWLTGLSVKHRGARTKQEVTNFALLQETCVKSAAKSNSAFRSQTLYNLVLSLWQLSFDEAGMAALQSSGIVSPLIQLLKEGAPAPAACNSILLCIC
jgi:hypothetical protein